MALTIDELEIKIQSDATKASGGIDALAKSMGELKSAIGGASGLASNLTQIANAMQSYNAVGKMNLKSKINQLSTLKDLVPVLGGGEATQLAHNLRDIASAMTDFSAVPKLNVNVSSLSAGIKTLNEATASFDSARLQEFSSQMQGIANGLSHLSSVGKTNISSIVNSLKKIPEITSNLDPATLESFAKVIERLTTIMTPLGIRMDAVARGFNSLPKSILRAMNATNKQTQANNRLNKSFGGLFSSLSRTAARFWTLYYSMSRVVNKFAEWFTTSNDYIESLNLFNVSLGDAADLALEYAEAVSDAMGIDIAEWITNQGVFKNLATGFGVASDAAATMSQNLTQLTYDMASFFNTKTETAFDKLSAAMSGQVKGLREFGIDTTVASLQQYALAKGIDTSVRSMTQAQKAILRYSYIMEQSADLGILGDMAKTIQSPANAIRILNAQLTQLQRALGNIVSVLVTRFIPWMMAAADLATEFAETLAKAWGFEVIEFPDIDIELGAEVEDETEQAEDALNKLKKQLMGFDELNILKNDDDSKETSNTLDIELPEYDFTKGFEGLDLEPYKEKLKKLLDIVTLIGVGFAAWKVTTSLLNGLQNVKKLLQETKNISSTHLDFAIEFKVLGAVMFLADIEEFIKYFDDFQANGATFHNVTGMISEFVGGIGDLFILLGKFELGGALKVVQGVGEIAVAIEDISNNGVNRDNAYTAIRGLTNIAIGIGVFTGNIKVAAWSVALQGFSTVVYELQQNWDAIKEGDWSGVDKSALVIGGLEMLGGLLVAFDTFGKLKKSVPDVSKVPEVIETTSTTTSALNTKMISLAKNMGLGVAIIAEVAVATVLFVSAIWLVGEELKKISEAFGPVIENGGTVVAALGIGTALLAGVGVASALLGTVGTPLIANIALGTAILAELGVATLLFISEIWIIGEVLNEVNDAWKPVIENGETIATAIGVGTGLLVGVGVVTAALGLATVATAGALPLAIALGTAMLVELGIAFVALVESLVIVADVMVNDLAPSLKAVNGKIPGLTENMGNFTNYLKEFAKQFTDYTKSLGKTTWANIVNDFIGLFSGNPIEALADNVSDIGDDTSNLIRELNNTIPKLETAISLVGEFNQKMSKLGSLMEAEKSNGGLLSSIGSAVGSLFSRTSFWMPNTSTTNGNVGMYASGGFPNMGEMFIAREAGPELVGRIGNKNAVVNNQQIISGIASAVYNAMMSAHEDSNSGGGSNARIVVQIGDRAVGEAAVNFINGQIVQTGVNPIHA